MMGAHSIRGRAKKEIAKARARAEEAALKGRQYQIANLDIVPEQHQKTPLLPDKLMKKYVEVDGKFYYGNATEKLAFEDAGDKLKTKLVPVYKCQVIEIQLKNRKKTMRNPVQDGTIMI